MRWAVAGAGGMLGRDVVRALDGRAHAVRALDRAALDVTDPVAVARAVAGADVVVNCAAWTAVDDAEAAEAAAFAVNALGPLHLARACAAAGARLVHVSTDYVFGAAPGGTAGAPWAEDAPVTPASAYGRTKAAGEWAVRAELDAHWILRTGWLYGTGGRNFVATMLGRARAGAQVRVVADQRGQPTWSRDLAERIVEVVERGAPAGTYHATCSGSTTWHELAQEVYRLVGADPALVSPITSGELDRPAPRPADARLAHGAWAAAGLPPLRPWAEALHAAFPALAAGTGTGTGTG